jgi:cytidine deaminase
MTNKELIDLAIRAQANAYAPYSGFKVGAALLCEDGEVFVGANVENSSFGLTNCAERSALFAAVSRGKRSFKAIAVVGGADGVVSDFCPPCGACRQALAEFSRGGSLRVILYDGKKVKELPLLALLPESFTL